MKEVHGNNLGIDFMTLDVGLQAVPLKSSAFGVDVIQQYFKNFNLVAIWQAGGKPEVGD